MHTDPVTAGDDDAFAAPPAPPGAAAGPGPRPTFSVVIAAYQAAEVIGDALRSVLAQTEPPLEIVVGDDGSTDDLAAAVAPFGDRVTLLTLPHAGAPAASNAAVDHARGDFVVILDADDTWEPARLERMADLAVARPDLDVVTTDAWFVQDGRRGGRFYEVNDFETADQRTEILRRTFVFGHVAVRRSRWVEVGGFTEDLPRGYDWDLQLRLLLSGSAVGCVLEPLASYVIHPQSLSASRYASMMARVDLLDRAEARHTLSPAQHEALATARATYRRRGLAARAEHSLMERSPDRRRAALDLLRQPGAGRRERVFLALAVVAPGWAGSRLRRQAEARGRAASDRDIALNA